MKIVFVKEKQHPRVVKDIKKATGAQVVTTDKHACTPELNRNKYGRAESK